MQTAPTSLSKASTSFGSMSRQFALTLLGYLNSWLALAGAALERRSGLPYGRRDLQGRESEFRHSMVLHIYHIGDTKSAQELEVFLRMPEKGCCAWNPVY